MADRTILTKTTAPGSYAAAGVAVTMTAADTANKNRFLSTGKELLIAQNTDAVNPYTVTIYSTADPYGRSKDITAESLVAGAIHVFGPFPQTGWQQTTGYIHVDGSNAAIKFGVVVLP